MSAKPMPPISSTSSSFVTNTATFFTSSSVVTNTAPILTSGASSSNVTFVGLSGSGGGMSGGAAYTSVGTLPSSSGGTAVVESISRSPYNNMEPTVGTTAVSVYQISALLDAGNSVSAVHREFPSLSRDKISAAWDYAKRFPNPAADYPTQTLKDFVLKSDLYKLPESPQ